MVLREPSDREVASGEQKHSSRVAKPRNSHPVISCPSVLYLNSWEVLSLRNMYLLLVTQSCVRSSATNYHNTSIHSNSSFTLCTKYNISIAESISNKFYIIHLRKCRAHKMIILTWLTFNYRK